MQLFPKLQFFSISNDEAIYLLQVSGCSAEKGLQHPPRADSPCLTHEGSVASTPAVVKDIAPWICSWRDVLGLEAQSSHKESAGCCVGFGSMPHEAIFLFPAVLRKLFNILRDQEPCCLWVKADCSFWQHTSHPTTPADSAHG